MDWTTVITFIDPSLLIVVVVCWIIGYALKQIKKIPDWSIIFVVTLLAMIIVALIKEWNVDAILQGVLISAVAVYGNQIVKQIRKGGSDDDKS